MAEFRETVLTFWSTLPLIATMYFWPVAMRILSAAAAHPRDSCSTSPSPSPNPATEICSPESLNVKIDTCLWWMGTLFASALSIIYLLKKFVDTAAAAETKGNTMEDEAPELACEDLKVAIRAVCRALDESTPDSRDEYVTAIGRRNVAMGKAARTKPKEGLARFPRRMRAWVRTAFLFALGFSFMSGCFAAAAFHFSLQLRAGCKIGRWDITSFAIVGFVFSLAHMQTAVVAWTRH